MSCDASKSLLCNNIFHPLHILSTTHVFLLWSSRHFCTATLLNICFYLPPKLWDVSSSIWFHYMQRSKDVLWNFWVNQPHLHSGPSWWFVQHPYYCLLFGPWSFLLLVVLHAKPLSPGACIHWHIFGSWNNATHIVSRFEVLQILH